MLSVKIFFKDHSSIIIYSMNYYDDEERSSSDATHFFSSIVGRSLPSPNLSASKISVPFM